MNDWMSKLERAKALFDSNALTLEEFEAEKARLLPQASPWKSEPQNAAGPTRGSSADTERRLTRSKLALFVGLALATGIAVYLATVDSTNDTNRNAAEGDAPSSVTRHKEQLASVPAAATIDASPAPSEGTSFDDRMAITSRLFNLFPGQGKIELLQCHMDVCSWSQLKSIETVRADDQTILAKVTTRSGMSEHDPNDDPEYPESYSSSVPIEWGAAKVSYVLCSLERPMDASPVDGEWLINRLNIVSPAGYELSAVQEYLQVCHSLRPGSSSEKLRRSLGYREQEGQQLRAATADSALATMK